MTKKTISSTSFGLLFAMIFSVNLFAQKSLPGNADLAETTAWLKKYLPQNASHISHAKFEGCQAEIRQDGFQLGFTPVGNGNNGGGFVGGGFPRDDSSGYFSAGAGTAATPSGGFRVENKFVFNLADLDSDGIAIKPSTRKNKSIVFLPAVGSKNSILLTENKRTISRSQYFFTVDTKHAGKFADAFRQAVKRCK